MRNLFAGKTLAALMIGIVAATFAFDADAQRRLGGGKNLGRQSAPVQQRQATPPQQQTPQAGNPQQAPAAAAAQRPGAAPAAAPRSPWRSRAGKWVACPRSITTSSPFTLNSTLPVSTTNMLSAFGCMCMPVTVSGSY